MGPVLALVDVSAALSFDGIWSMVKYPRIYRSWVKATGTSKFESER